MPENKGEERVKLNTTFLTGPGGLIYEIPLDVAASYVVSPERVKELGHLPIRPYQFEQSTDPVLTENEVASEQYDVEGRHLGLGIDQWGKYTTWHNDCRYGAYIGTDGHSYFGIHRHPWGTELGVSCAE